MGDQTDCPVFSVTVWQTRLKTLCFPNLCMTYETYCSVFSVNVYDIPDLLLCVFCICFFLNLCLTYQTYCSVCSVSVYGKLDTMYHLYMYERNYPDSLNLGYSAFYLLYLRSQKQLWTSIIFCKCSFHLHESFCHQSVLTDGF